jgi:Ankyrin repeat
MLAQRLTGSYHISYAVLAPFAHRSSSAQLLYVGCILLFVHRVHLLLQRGADVNARNNLQVTPLGKAAVAGHLDAMRVLIAAGADIEALDDISVSCGALTLLFAVLMMCIASLVLAVDTSCRYVLHLHSAATAHCQNEDVTHYCAN